MINSQALNWALKKADSHTLARYNRIGNKLEMGSDIQKSSYFGWVKEGLEMTADSGETKTVVSSPYISD